MYRYEVNDFKKSYSCHYPEKIFEEFEPTLYRQNREDSYSQFGKNKSFI